MTAILLLAAGASRRMRGRDKLAETIDGTPLLSLQARRACAIGVPVFVTLPALDHPRTALVADLPLTVVPVPDAHHGMAASLKAGLAAIPDAHAVLITLADLVDIDTSDLRAVIAAKDDAPEAALWRGATAVGKPGHPILIPAQLRAKFAQLSGDSGGASILKPLASETHIVHLPDNRALTDLDTPEDWAAWRASRQT